MSDGSRFASLSRRARALLGSGDTSVIALVAEGAATGAGGESGAADEADEGAAQPAPPAPPAPPPPPPPPPPAPAAAEEEGGAAIVTAEQLAVDDPAHPAFVAGAAAANQRVAEVFASEASNGKERAAAKLLANPKLSAGDIIDLLPDVAASASDGMLKTLAETRNPDLGAGSESGGAAAESKTSWNKTFERLGWDQPKK
jgi:hypothetical protein